MFAGASDSAVKMFVPIVISDHYQTYDLNPEVAVRGSPLLMAGRHSTQRRDESQTRLGGVLREFTFEGNPKKKGVFLEPLYYTKV